MLISAVQQHFVVAESLSCVRLSVTPWTAARQPSLSSTTFWSLLKFMSMSQWCQPTISSSVVSFSSCLQSFPASGSFPMNPLFASGGQSVGASASASVFPMNIQGWFPLGWTGLISLPLFTHLQCGNSFSQSINQSVLNKISLKTSFVLYAEKNSSVHGA